MRPVGEVRIYGRGLLNYVSVGVVFGGGGGASNCML